jgi:hypothetical protein
MRAPFTAAGLVAALLLATPSLGFSPAFAADLDGEQYAEPSYDENSAYDDGAYDERPRYDNSRRTYRDADVYEESYDEAGTRPGSIKDGYPVPVPPPHRAEAPPLRDYDRAPARPYRAERYACLEHWQIRKRLRRDGWAGIRPMGGDGAVVNISARRFESGRAFNLRVDRCSGDVLAARPEYLRSFAYRDRPWHRY